MARKKIREHDGKRILREQIKRFSSKLNFDKLLTVLVTKDTDWKKLIQQNPWLNESPLVAKPDMLFGKRGKNNLVLLNASISQVESFVRERFGKEIVIGETKGTLTHFLIEPFVPHTKEFYLSIASKREVTKIFFSVSGGVDVEDNWDKVKSFDVPVCDTFDQHSSSIQQQLFDQVDPDDRDLTSEFVRAIFGIFEDLDFTSLEMNPFVFVDYPSTDPNGNRVASALPLDLVAELDSTAGFKSGKKWGKDLEFPQAFGRLSSPEEVYVESLDEKTGASLKLTLLNPYGTIWNLVAGGGASVIFADTVADLGYGHQLGNYGEYSGAPNEEETYNYARTILSLVTRYPSSDGKPKALLIGGGIANFTDIAKTFKGIINALKEYRDRLVEHRVKIFVRRAGPNYQQALKLIRDLSEKTNIPIDVFGPEKPMTSIIPLAVKYVESGKGLGNN